jgi:hypothetical protein
MKHLPPNCLNQNANGTIRKHVSRVSQWVPMLRGFDKLLEFSSFLFSNDGDQSTLNIRHLATVQYFFVQQLKKCGTAGIGFRLE